ncbi:recombinase family protein [Streptococcus suis]|uniref:recombinase family protein n=1 Tax=Streptococcus suis TaxID=1307 RepID=UPI000422A1D9|nr:recombinase family protein [Streptococcus suis]NQH20659.1 recombinase family protein [Streptococcus suis]CYU78672.1 transposon Tn917 resolvase [Streptococcus suis]HEL1600856.1 recombinase family protein [Streptococcus suis]HEL9647187.1 recombinase family protein [Streptococcus suis]HEM2798411.1 recombinase family protein [Streptococcus suis]
MKKIIKQYQEKGSVIIGYARVSSTDNRQELGLEVQKEVLNFCDKLYIEKESGGNQDRPQLQKALKLAKECAESDIETSFVVYKLDRLTRKMLHLSAIISELTSYNIRLQSIHEQIETDSLTGKFFCLMLGYVAEWELQAISARTKDGLRKARERGVQLGNKGISKSKEKQVIISYLEKEMTVRDIASQFQISTATIYSVLKRNNIQANRKINPKIVDKSKKK